MDERLHLVLAQLNQTVGDLSGNLATVLETRRGHPKADLVICPELCISGYPPEDLSLRRSYVAACEAMVETLAKATGDEPGPWLVVGTPMAGEPGDDQRPYNTGVLIGDGKVQGIAKKVCLPNYGPFDEPRTFRPATEVNTIPFRGLKLGLMVCEDMWYPEVAADLHKAGADVLIVPHGSPFRRTVHEERLVQAKARTIETDLPLAFVNQCGGQDELIFDGGCFVMQKGEVVASSPLFVQHQLAVDLVKTDQGWRVEEGAKNDWPTEDELIYQALVTGTRDYIAKSGFKDVVIGLSGGVDSALVAAIAVDALGPEHVHCVRLPSRYTSEGSMVDAEACAKALGIRLDTVGIEPAVSAFDGMLDAVFDGRAPDVTEENLQSRIRGTALMAISNKLGSMMLTTGNKSEMACGYATLYGDMNGGFNPLKDVYKTRVFSLCRWRNTAKPAEALGPDGVVIPEVIINKPPSAELREDQKDEDSLPPYDVLDDILHGLIEEELSVAAIAERGHDIGLVRRVQTMLYRAEFKRKQSAPGPKVSRRYFGRDRRYPIINRFKE
ncbi:MAG: NAD+ synthase [Pseudomonadota bacterium]